jgi:hypothetical protein
MTGEVVVDYFGRYFAPAWIAFPFFKPLIEKRKEYNQETHFLLADHNRKAFDSVHHNKLWEIIDDISLPGNLIQVNRFCFRTRKMSKYVQSDNLVKINK